MAFVEDDLWCHILWSATEGPSLLATSDLLGKAKVDLEKESLIFKEMFTVSLSAYKYTVMLKLLKVLWGAFKAFPQKYLPTLKALLFKKPLCCLCLLRCHKTS